MFQLTSTMKFPPIHICLVVTTQIFLINSSQGVPIDIKSSKISFDFTEGEGRTFGTWTDFLKVPGRFLSNLAHQIAYIIDPSFPFYTPGTVGYFQYPVNFGNRPLVAGSNFGYEQTYQISPTSTSVAPTTPVTPTTPLTPIVVSNNVKPRKF